MFGVAGEWTVVSSAAERAAVCTVCGGVIDAGDGITAVFRGRRLRFRCEGCLRWLAEDPRRFLAGHAERCCPDDTSPASEWTCD